MELRRVNQRGVESLNQTVWTVSEPVNIDSSADCIDITNVVAILPAGSLPGLLWQAKFLFILRHTLTRGADTSTLKGTSYYRDPACLRAPDQGRREAATAPQPPPPRGARHYSQGPGPTPESVSGNTTCKSPHTWAPVPRVCRVCQLVVFAPRSPLSTSFIVLFYLIYSVKSPTDL